MDSNNETRLESRQHQINSVARAFQVLEYLKRENRAVTISELAKAIGVPRSSVFRIVKTMESSGYIADVDHTGRYVLGARIISLAIDTDHMATLRQTAGPYMFELATTTGQTVQLGRLFEYEIMYIDQIQATEGLSVVVPSEKPFPINLSAGGKALAAHLPEAQIEEFLRCARFRRNTEKTIMDANRFREELRRVRGEGLAYDDEEFAVGIRCIAAPVFDHQGRSILSIGITGHCSEITDAEMPRMGQAVREAADALSRAFGCKTQELV